MTTTTDGRRVLPFELTVRSEILTLPVPPVPRWKRLVPAAVVWAAVLAGFALRGYCYARNPSLWIDEAMLALNVVYRSPSQLLEPLDLNQGAPVGFLLASKAAVAAFGGGEFALRLIPFLAAMAGLLMFVPLAYRALPLAAARVAVGLFALSPYLAGYGAEFKQYESDATFAVLLTLVGLPVWDGTAGRWRLAGFALAGAGAVWFSHPAAFVLGGVGLASLFDAAVRRDRVALLARLAVVGCWAASFGACYLLFTRKLGMNDYLLTYWAGKFMPLPPTGPGDLAWLVDHFFQFFDKPTGLHAEAAGMGGLAGVMYLIGCRKLAEVNWRLLVALAVPLLLALLASGLKKYPFAGRLMLYAVPAALLVVSYGATLTAGLLGRALPGAGAVLLTALFAAPISQSVWLMKKPLHDEDTRDVLSKAHAGWQPGDRMYVFYGAVPAFGYYHPRFPFPADAVSFGVENRGGPQQVFQTELEPFRGSRRVWVIVAHRQTPEETAVRAYLDGMGSCEVFERHSDAVLMRYDLSAKK
ncbi:MAG: hypothetical protein ACRC7O_01095 [Fimbriiglobus sp.]